MNVIILAGGYATRLYPLTIDTHKALLPLNDQTILDVVVDKIAALTPQPEITLITNAKFYDDFAAWGKTRTDAGVLEVVNDGSCNETERFGSIGDLRIALDACGRDEDILVLASDNLFQFALGDFISFSNEHAPGVSLAVYDVGSLEAASLYGTVELDEASRITAFIEKPPQPTTSLVSMGVYFFPQEKIAVIDKYIAGGGNPDKMGSLIEWVIEQDEAYAFCSQGWWFDIGDKDMYDKACYEFSGKEL